MEKKSAKEKNVIDITTKHPGHMQIDQFVEKYKSGKVSDAVIIADIEGELFRIHVTDSEKSRIIYFLWITLLEMGLDEIVDFED